MSALENLDIRLAHFRDLSPFELYDLLQLRSEIFVVEQNCVFLEMDNKDKDCWHLMFYKDGKLAAYSRLLAQGKSYTEMSIGRVVTASFVRGTGMGVLLMQRSVEECFNLFGKGPIRIGAQNHLRKFYGSIGFEVAGDIYDEDGIDHVEMLRP